MSVEQNTQLGRIRGAKIIFAVGNLELGGAERQAFLLAKYLKDHIGSTVEFWGMAKTGEGLTRLLDANKIPWLIYKEPTRDWHARIKWTRLIRFIWMAKKRKPDIVLSYLIETNILMSIYGKRTGAKLVVWNQRDCGLFYRKTNYTDLAFKMAEHFVTNSLGGKQFIVEKGGIVPERVTVINNAITIPTSYPDRMTARRNLNIPEDCFSVAMVANLHGSKDHSTLLKAWKSFLEHYHSPAKLFLAGRWDTTYQQLKSYCEENQLDSVVFLGQVKDIPALWSAMDLGVLCSPSEGSPNGLLECMAMGLPVVGTDILGIRGAMGPQNEEYLYPDGNAEALARIILNLADDPDLRRQLGKANLERISEEFLEEKVHKQYIQYILERYPHA